MCWVGGTGAQSSGYLQTGILKSVGGKQAGSVSLGREVLGGDEGKAKPGQTWYYFAHWASASSTCQASASLMSSL